MIGIAGNQQEVRAPARPPFLSSVTAKSESGNRDFTPAGLPVTSPKGAKFSMQVMPATAAKPGLGVAPAKADTPAEYNRVGREYLSALHQRYGGDLAKMWGAYNLGLGKVDSLIQSFGNNWLRYAPKETRDYVAANIAALRGQ